MKIKEFVFLNSLSRKKNTVAFIFNIKNCKDSTLKFGKRCYL